MDYILAKTSNQAKSNKLSLKQIQEQTQNESKIFYFSNENAHKDLLKIVESFQKNGRSAYLREAKFGLDEKEYIYELHII